MASPRPETRFAKQLFLYGNGDGKPVRNVPTLAKLSGVHENTLNKYLPEWEKEAESIVANASEMGLAIQLNRDQLDQNNKDLDFIRNQINKIKFEIDTLETIAERLGDWLDKFDGDDMPLALQIFSDWQRATGTESALRGQFIAMKKLWDEKSAIDGLRDVALTREKEISKGKAKLEIKQLESVSPARDATPAGFFKRDRPELLDG